MLSSMCAEMSSIPSSLDPCLHTGVTEITKMGLRSLVNVGGVCQVLGSLVEDQGMNKSTLHW